MKEFWSDRIRSLTPYTPGEQPKGRKFIKLNTNENPYPPSPKALAAIQANTDASLRLYSDPDAADLRAAIAKTYSVKPEQVFVGNGSDEVLAFAFQAFYSEGAEIVFPDITYSFYPVYANMFGICYRTVPLKDDFTVPVDALCGGNDGVVIANPNAPTGMELPQSEIRHILEANPNVVVIVDEAYVDFGAESCVPLVDRYPNLLVVQTFSKSRNLAGARLGFAIGSEELIADLNRVKFSYNPYNINRLTLKAGQAALEDTAYFDQTRTAIIETREWTKQQLEQRGFACTESRSNFLFAESSRQDGGTLYRKLKEKGVLVRHFDAPRIANRLRITIGTPEEMQALLAALDEILEA